MASPLPAAARSPVPCAAVVLALDFANKRDRSIELGAVPAALAGDDFVWLEFCVDDATAVRDALLALDLLDADVVEAVLSADVASTYSRYERYLHLVLCAFSDGSAHQERRVDVVLGERFLFTFYRGAAGFLSTVRREYRADFQEFAKTPSFLLFEIWDQLMQNYLDVQKRLEERVEELQARLKAEQVDADLFARIAELGAELLRFRRVVLPARTVLTDLASRRSRFVSDVTQQALANVASTAEHILGDLVTDRELLSEAVNLYMSALTHRTNDTMKKLTAVSVVFLPLTFVVGVYGMNFENLPELHWQYGYLYFWFLVAALVAGLLVALRRARFL